MKYLLVLVFLVGCSHENSPTVAETPIVCEILRENDTPLRGIECIELPNDVILVKLYLVEKTIKAHSSRVRWKDKEDSDFEKELLKPWRDK